MKKVLFDKRLLGSLMLVFSLYILFGQGSIARAEEITEEMVDEIEEEQTTFYVSNAKEFKIAADGNYIATVVRDVILTEDINATCGIYSGCNMLIDLNGHTLTLPDNTGISTNQEGQLIIGSSEKGGKILMNFTENSKNFGIYNDGSFVLESGTIYLKAFRSVLINNSESGKLAIKGGTLQFVGDDSIKDVSDSSQTGIFNSGTISFSGGELKMSGANSYRIGIRNFIGAKVYLKGGTIDVRGKYARGIHNEGIVSITKGIIDSGWMGIVQKGKLTMSGGAINSVGNGIFLGNCKSTIINGGEIISTKECGIFYGSGDAIPIITKGTITGTMAIASNYKTSAEGEEIKCSSATLILE